MRTSMVLGVVGALAACGSPQSTFNFTFSNAIGHVSDAVASGEVDNAGFLVVDDQAWELDMSLGGLTVGPHGGVQVSILNRTTNEVFSTTTGGTCSSQVQPHDSTNGSTVSGTFMCNALQSNLGNQSNVAGQFVTYISDTANNPSGAPPGT